MFNKKRKFRADTFNMLDERLQYESINQKVLDGSAGWMIIEEKGFTNEMGDYLIFMKWTEPKS